MQLGQRSEVMLAILSLLAMPTLPARFPDRELGLVDDPSFRKSSSSSLNTLFLSACLQSDSNISSRSFSSLSMCFNASSSCFSISEDEIVSSSDLGPVFLLDERYDEPVSIKHIQYKISSIL